MARVFAGHDTIGRKVYIADGKYNQPIYEA